MDTLSIQQLTIGEIVAKDIRAADIFFQLNIDFCCGGNRLLSEAAAEAGVSALELEERLTGALNGPTEGLKHYQSMSATQLIDHIKNTHHKYIRDHAGSLTALAAKVARVHGSSHPELNELAERLHSFFDHLDTHLEEEETQLFPALLAAGDGIPGSIISLEDILNEHKVTGADLLYFRKLTDNYSIPDDACSSYAYLFNKLKELEEDMLIHIHLENNILFAKASHIKQNNLA